MSGSVKRYRLDVPLYNMVEDPHGYWIDRDDYEAVVREREEAERKLADALQSVQSWQMEVLGRDSDIEQLRTLLDEEQRDANRYKWLRDVWRLGEYFDTPDPVTQANSAEEFDAAIDEARILRAGETK